MENAEIVSVWADNGNYIVIQTKDEKLHGGRYRPGYDAKYGHLKEAHIVALHILEERGLKDVVLVLSCN